MNKLPVWWRVALAFVAGTLIGSAFLLVYLAWRQPQDHPPAFAPQMADLVGDWEGQENYGTTYTVTRRADGTFSESRDSSRSSAPTQPPVIASEGRFAVDGTSYAFYYTKSGVPAWLNRPPTILTLHDCIATRLNFPLAAGKGGRELKKQPPTDKAP